MKIDKALLWKRLKKIGIISLWVLMISGLMLSLGFVNKEEQKVKCSAISVDIEPETELQFVNRDIILHTIRPDGIENKIIGQKITALHTPQLEDQLERNAFIKQAEVFTDMNGILSIHIHQREPILRVINSTGGQFYLDRDGHKMPISPIFTARVPIANGNIFESETEADSIQSFVAKELYKIATYVDKDAFWKAQIEQIFVNTESELILIPKVGDHTIMFGNTIDMEKKFDKLMLFYKEALSRIGWEKYSNIDLRYKDQIVCKKKL